MSNRRPPRNSIFHLQYYLALLLYDRRNTVADVATVAAEGVECRDERSTWNTVCESPGKRKRYRVSAINIPC